MKWRFLYRGLKARYRDQRQEVGALVAALKPGEIAVDVGANKGSYLPALSRAVRRGKVIAFEPQPLLAAYLADACRAAGLSNVVVEPAGISDRSGHLTLAIPGTGESSPGASFETAVRDREACRTVDVKTHALDDYFATEARRVGAIKIDVEGHELSALQGATRVLATHRPLVVCECEARHMTHGNVATVLGFFRDHGYDGHFVCQGRLLPVSQFDAAVHQKTGGERFWDAPGYCNNFIMSPAAGRAA
jgi:FkbM family methyltransferase